jgi:hypothetical protein
MQTRRDPRFCSTSYGRAAAWASKALALVHQTSPTSAPACSIDPASLAAGTNLDGTWKPRSGYMQHAPTQVGADDAHGKGELHCLGMCRNIHSVLETSPLCWSGSVGTSDQLDTWENKGAKITHRSGRTDWLLLEDGDSTMKSRISHAWESLSWRGMILGQKFPIYQSPYKLFLCYTILSWRRDPWEQRETDTWNEWGTVSIGVDLNWHAIDPLLDP